ncbi:hypothetical protein [Haloplanus salilacus]|uniref:hypothetical protein n=1 Tax=Haloplanus salilacus TaxID=2949994 RepID=UPI0030D29462
MIHTLSLRKTIANLCQVSVSDEFTRFIRSKAPTGLVTDYFVETCSDVITLRDKFTDNLASIPVTDGGKDVHVSDPYADGTPLTWVFGNTPETKVVAAFLSEPDTALDTTDIARLAGVNRTVAEKQAKQLDKYGLVSCHGGNETELVYQLDIQDENVVRLHKMEDSFLKREYNQGG